jgi:hypothetical protein
MTETPQYRLRLADPRTPEEFAAAMAGSLTGPVFVLTGQGPAEGWPAGEQGLR